MKIIPTKNRNKEAPSDDSTAIQRKKWVRKAPLISSAVGPNDATVDPRSMKTKHVINSDNKNGRTMGEIREQLLNFLNSIHLEEWGPDERFRRFYVFGDYISCVRWEGKFWISGPDIFKAQCALYRLDNGRPVPLKRKFEESILTQLRNIPEENGMRIESAGSPFISYLFGIGAVRTRKRQKLFEWSAVQHETLVKAKRSAASDPSDKKEMSRPRRKSYVIKSIEIYDKSGMNALMNAIDIIEVTSSDISTNCGQNSSSSSFSA